MGRLTLSKVVLEDFPKEVTFEFCFEGWIGLLVFCLPYPEIFSVLGLILKEGDVEKKEKDQKNQADFFLST